MRYNQFLKSHNPRLQGLEGPSVRFAITIGELVVGIRRWHLQFKLHFGLYRFWRD